MKTFAILFLTALVVSVSAQPARSPAPVGAGQQFSPEISPAAILTVMKASADWQLAHPSSPGNQKYGEQAWTYGVLFAGVMALDDIADTSKYHRAMLAKGRQLRWQPGPRPYYADDHVVSQMYLELFLKDHRRRMLWPTMERFESILARPATNDLRMGAKGAEDRWNWCDSLFMAPPVWARLYQATGDRRYLDFMDREWRATSAFLYDTNEHLYFRDSTYFKKREANGGKIFWSRGEGWVLAGLARVIPLLPADYAGRAFYEQQFREMAAKIASLQQADGLWRASLLDPESYPLKETSGSGFHTFALAWGINNDLLDRGTYGPVVRKAWRSLVECVTPEGKLEHVQPVGADPKKFDPTHTDVYGTGAFLLAGSEMYRLAQEPAAAAK